MNRHFFSFILIAAFFATMCSSCNKDDSSNEDNPIDLGVKMIMTTEASEVSFQIGGTGRMIIDWGDGTPLGEYVLSPADRNLQTPIYAHEYSNISTHTLTINAENITTFGSNENQLTSLDVSNNTALINLSCSNEYQLKKLDVSKNIALKLLLVRDTKLKSLDVSKNIALTNLHCFQNFQLEELDVRNNIKLEILDCGNNKLTELDVSKNIALIHLNCCSNQLVELDVSNNSKLETLACYNNKLTELDVKNNKELTHLMCLYNQLTNLDVSENTALLMLACDENQFDDISLNVLFGTLHGRNITYLDGNPKTIYIGGNPGTDNCEPNVAMSKGWVVKKFLFSSSE
jgi:hypothetical protein